MSQLHCCHCQRMLLWTGIFCQGTCSFLSLSCSYVFFSSSFFFYLQYFFPSCFSCSFSPVIVLLCMFANHFPYSSIVIFVGESLSAFLYRCLFSPSLCLTCLCLVSHECVCEQRVHRTHLSSSTEHTLMYKRSGMAQFGGGFTLTDADQVKSDNISRGLEWMV